MAEKQTAPEKTARIENSALPYAVRYRICAMLQDGVPAEILANDPEICNAYEQIGRLPEKSDLKRIRRTREYREIARKRSAFRRDQEMEALTAAMLRETGSAENTAESIKIALLKTISELTDLSAMPDEEDKIKALRSLTQSVAVLSNAAKDRTIHELKNRLARAIVSKNKLKAEIEQLKLKQEAELRRIRNSRKNAEPERIADELADILGVRKK